MFRNYLIAAWRNARRERLHAAINVAGLALGLAAAILIGLFVRDELSYDQFLAGHDRVFRVSTRLGVPGRTPVWEAAAPEHTGPALALDFPEFEGVARLDADRVGVRHGEVEALERIAWADPAFLSVIGLPVIAGDAATALDAPDSVVLTRGMARKYFGTDTPIGATLELSRIHPMRVTAVIEDLPSNTHLDIAILVSGRAPFSDLATEDATTPKPGTVGFSGSVYVRLRPGVEPAALSARLADFVPRHFPPSDGGDPQQEATLTLSLDPVTGIHLLSETIGEMKGGGSVATVIAMSVVALLILAIASINFINLMTARAARRAIEVGIRKAHGATQPQLVVQFLGEAVAFAAIAGTLAIALVEIVLPWFNGFLDRKIGFAYWHDPVLAGAIVLLVLIVGAGAGFYPALVLAGFRPAVALKGRRGGAGGGKLRQVLVVLQFAISIGLAVSTLVIVRQTAFATGESLRFDKDQVLMVQGAEGCGDAFRDSVAALPGVRGVTCSRAAPLDFSTGDSTAHLADGREVAFNRTPIDFGFFELYGLHPLAGRSFDRARPGDAVPAEADGNSLVPVVINEAAARVLGAGGVPAALGQEFTMGGIRSVPIPTQVIGVVADFPIGSIRQAVEPTVFFVDPTAWGLFAAKLDGRRVPETVTAIDRLWAGTVNRPIRRFFLDAKIEEQYRDIERQGRLFAGFATVALLIGCLGLFGLSAFTAEQRTKEIGIRKAMGANRLDIVKLLVWQFLKPVLIANLLAWPVAWWFMRRWLDGFAYRIELGPTVFVAAGAGALVIAVLTTAGHAYQVARARPVMALRDE
jgi:putative ABC transport system permease protein